MIQSHSASHAKEYFNEALARADYYVTDQELPGFWQGRLAERLGLTGDTTKEAFHALCDNEHPGTGEKLTPRMKENRTTGYDINFHCPKSVSVLNALSADDHILKAFRESVTETMHVIEADSQTRVRKDGKDENRPTGELVWGHFTHLTARPVEGSLPDPHLHSHCYVFNATWDATEERYKAAQFRDIKQDMPFYQAHFHKVLSDKLIALGYQIRTTEKSFEIEGVPQQVIDLFSKRTDQIGRVAQEKGIIDPKERGELGARTRAGKQKDASMAELAAGWRSQINTLASTPGNEEKAVVRYAPVMKASPLSARQCVDHAVLHGFERASVVDDRRLLQTALHRALGIPGASAAEIVRGFNEDKRIIHVKEGSRTLCTTKEVLAEERRMVDLARSGQGAMQPLYATAPELSLTGLQQRRAIDHVLTTPNRVSIIRGAAGSGKTTLMKEAVEKITEAGKEVITVAPTAQASRGVLREAGFAEATTVAQLLTDKVMQEKLKNNVLWVDEAGLLGTKDTTALLELATRQNARVIFGGDTRQHASVVRGDALRILNTVAGIQTAEVSTIYRQTKAQYRDTVKDLADGNVASAFTKLDNMGCIRDMESGTLAKDYVDAILRGKNVLVISPTHAQGMAVTKEIRDELRREGLLADREIEAVQYRNLQRTEAERSNPRQFSVGELVQFNQNVSGGFQRGSQWTVTEATVNAVQVRNADGETRQLPLHQSKRFDVFAVEKIALSVGDKVLITKNGFDAAGTRLNNGELLTVVSTSQNGMLVLENTSDKSKATYTVPTSFGHMAYAHSITSYAAQGKTVDEVFIVQPASTFPATDAKQFYVSVSRAREQVYIYTDNKEELLHHASHLRERQSALELVGIGRHKASVNRQQQAEQEAEQERDEREREQDDYEPTREL